MNNEVKKAIAQLKKNNVNDAVEKKAGRPVDPNSINQQLKAAREALKAAGIEVKRGRPIDENSDRQKRLREQLAKLQARLVDAGISQVATPTQAATPESED